MTCRTRLQTVGPTENQKLTVNQNPLGKFTRKLENEMPITFVDRQLIDSSQELNTILAKAASSCC